MTARPADRTGLYRTIASQHVWPFLLILVFAAVFFQRALGVGVLLQLEELILLVAVGGGIASQLMAQKINRLIPLYLVALGGMIVISLAGGYATSITTSVLACILFLKLPLLLYVFRNLVNYDLSRMMLWFLVFLVTGGALSLALPGYFLSLLPDLTYDIDGGRMMGFFVNANRQGALASILLLYFYFIKKQKLLALFCFGMLFLTESRSYFIATVMIFFYCYHQFVSKLSLMLLSPILIGAAGYLLIYEFNILETFGSIGGTLESDLRYIRAAMLAGGVLLATEFFPFGAGGGRFGSTLSTGSAAYDRVGIGNWDTVLDGSGIHDSGIGTILGEFGFAGLAVLAVALAAGFRIWSRRVLLGQDIWFLVFMVLFLSLFRQVISNFYFSFIIIGYAYVIVRLRIAKGQPPV